MIDYLESDTASLANIPNLKEVWLAGDIESPGSENPIDMAPFATATSLKSLALEDVTISGLNAIRELTQLTSLTLDASGDSVLGKGNYANQLSSLEFITPLINLEYLNLEGSVEKIADISALANLTNLRELDLSSGNISDISVLLKLPWVAEDDTVNLYGNPISAEQIEALRQKVTTVGF